MGRDALPAVPRLLKFLEPGDEFEKFFKPSEEWTQDRLEREEAGFALAEIGEPEVVEALLRFAVEATGVYRNPAVDPLALIENPDGVKALKEALRNQDVRVRRVAVQALVPHDYPSLLKVSDDCDPWIRRLVVENAGRFGDEKSLRVLRRAISDPDLAVRRATVGQLACIDPHLAIEPLASAAKDSDQEIRYAAVNALNGIQDRLAIDALILALNDEQPMIRSAAARGLGSVTDARVVASLEAATKDNDSFVRRHARASLEKVLAVFGRRKS